MLALLSQISSGKLQSVGGTASGIGGGAGGGVQIISREQSDLIEKANRGLAGTKKAIQDIGTASTHGARRGSIQEYLRNLNPTALTKTLNNNPDLQKVWAAMQQAPSIASSDPKVKNEARRQMRDTTSFMKDLTFGMMPLLNPGSPWGTLFATRQIFSAMMTEKGQGMLGRFGLSGTKGAGIAAGVSVGALTAIGFALEGFRKALEGAKQAIGKAFGIYTGAAQQGLSTSFFTNRQALGNVFGVQGNPNQVFQFGSAVQEVERRIAGATQTIANNAKPLAETEMNFRIMKLDVEALSSKIAVGLLPVLNAWINAIDFLSKLEPPAWLRIAARGSWAAVSFGTTEVLAGFTKFLGSKFGTTGFGAGGLPQLLGPMQQMPVSQWEKMGLVIAGGLQNQAVEYARRTAVATEKIARATADNVPRGSQNFGLDMQVANP